MIGRFFRSTVGQILMITASSSTVTFLFSLALFSWLYPNAPPRPPWPWSVAFRIESLVDGLRGVPERDRAALLAGVRWPLTEARLATAASVCDVLSKDTRELEAVLQDDLAATSGKVSVRECSDVPLETRVQILVGLGEQTLAVRTHAVNGTRRRLTFPLVGALVFLGVAVVLMSAWAVWLVIRPLRRLSDQVTTFGEQMSFVPLAEEGPLEIRRAAHAFNLMQERVTRSIQDRTRMLAAISHDMRSPLTRMRLQLDTAEPTQMVQKLSRETILMQDMVTSALGYLGNRSSSEAFEPLDLAALLQTICDEYADAGVEIHYTGPDALTVVCKPNAIQRAVGNLLENAIAFGSRIDVIATSAGDQVAVTIGDDGPGIPAHQLAEVIEPFVRLDPSRNARPGSLGLGLSIVSDIVQEHGGRLTLSNRVEGGLLALIELPLVASAP